MTRRQLYRILTGRVARNLYFWAAMLYFVLLLNFNNEHIYHYGIIRSPLYWPLILVSTLLQAAMIYTNNLLLIPRLLARSRPWAYSALVLLLIAGVSLIYTIMLKAAKPFLDVDNMQQAGFVTSPVSNSWSAATLLGEFQSYAFGNALWLFILTMAWYMNDYTRQRRLAEEAKRAQLATELAFLKSQLNPHFLFNTLNNLYALALKKADEAPDAILKLSAILRYLLYESNTQLVPFEKEQEIMQAYIDLELLRLKDKRSLHFSISADAPREVPPLLWLPVLENIFKHGARLIAAETFVQYTFSLTGATLLIRSENSFKPAAGTNGAHGIGLQNLRKRLELLYPGRHTLQSGPQGNKYITELSIDPL